MYIFWILTLYQIYGLWMFSPILCVVFHFVDFFSIPKLFTSLEKTLMLGGIGGRGSRGWQDEMAGWHHWLDGHESEWTLGVGDGQGDLACCDSWGRKESDLTEWLNWTELKKLFTFLLFNFCFCCFCFWCHIKKSLLRPMLSFFSLFLLEDLQIKFLYH